MSKREHVVRAQFFFFFALFITNDVALTQFLAIAVISRVASLDDSMIT